MNILINSVENVQGTVTFPHVANPANRIQIHLARTEEAYSEHSTGHIILLLSNPNAPSYTGYFSYLKYQDNTTAYILS